jgi:endonuclease YncB( thermonuclease family)
MRLEERLWRSATGLGWLFLLLLGSACAAPRPSATVVSFGDGDTLRVRQGEQTITVRLACIDAPEMAQRPHGLQARVFLQQRLSIGQQVRLDVKTTDRYGRAVAEVFSGSNINLALVEDGKAFVYRQYLDQCDSWEYLQAEERASRRRLGIWQMDGGITRPWDFRRSRRSSRSRSDSTPDGHRYTCREIGSHARAQELLRQGHTYLDGNRDGEACKSLRM